MEKIYIESKQQQTDPQDEEKRKKQHRIDQCMNTFFFQEGTVTIYQTINLYMNQFETSHTINCSKIRSFFFQNLILLL